jgi:two-component system, chemotaxis family, response regulator PixG
MATTPTTLAKETSSFKDLVAQLKDIKRTAFSGNLIIEIAAAPNWMLSFASGRLKQMHGGIDPSYRWQRNLEIAALSQPVSTASNHDAGLVNINVLAQQLSALEVLFDLIQFAQHNQNRLSYQLIPVNNYDLQSNFSLPLLEIGPLLSEAVTSWQEWKEAGLGSYSPGQFPKIDSASQSSLATTYPHLQLVITELDGNRSLRNLAISHHQHLLDFTKSLLPLLQAGEITLSDRSSTASLIEAEQPILPELNPAVVKIDQTTTQSMPLVACIDDSLSVYESLAEILTEHGYRSFGIQEPHKILPALLKNKPDLIFLDLIMPITNGYEVCEKIRKISLLKDIPIIILSSRDGSFERERAKSCGASGFLGKPVRSDSVLKMLDKYIKMSSKF